MKKILLWCTMLITSWAFAQATTQLGTGSGTTNYYPIYNYYNYNYSQTIYTATELTAQGAVAGNITKIRYKPTLSAATTNWKAWEVYLLGSTKAKFSSTSDWVPVSSMTKVFDSTLPSNVTANTWMELTLSTPFDWNGTDNIIVAVYEKTPGYVSANQVWGGGITPIPQEKAYTTVVTPLLQFQIFQVVQLQLQLPMLHKFSFLAH